MTKGRMRWSLIKFSQLINWGTVWRSILRISKWISGLKGVTLKKLTWMGADCTWIVPLVKVTVGSNWVCASCDVFTVVRAGIADDTAGCIITADRPAELTAACKILTWGKVCWICCKATCCTVSACTGCWDTGFSFGFLGLGFSCHHFMRPWDGGSRSPPKIPGKRE